MRTRQLVIHTIVWALLTLPASRGAQQRPSDAHLPREQWGAPPVSVSQAGGNWVVSGKKNRVTINASDLTMKVDAGPVTRCLSTSWCITTRS
ncbi:MAG TPA: hypothetical protein VKI65_06215 [Gemmataceae bacterium]|nr:hypothetical protein [Gemmataceae bacterium]